MGTWWAPPGSGPRPSPSDAGSRPDRGWVADTRARGLGAELRIATLHLGFLGLDGDVAGTGAFADNGPSLGVTRKLGYEPNGVDRLARRGEPGELHRYRMSRAQFLEEVRRDDITISGDDHVRELLGISR